MDRTAQQHAATDYSLLLDAEGFLIDPGVWTRETARNLARMDGLGELGAEHWAIIDYLREHYQAYQSLPPMSHVCRSRRLEKHAVRRLFGGCREAWRIAGLPDPGEEAKAYM